MLIESIVNTIIDCISFGLLLRKCVDISEGGLHFIWNTTVRYVGTYTIIVLHVGYCMVNC